MDFGLTLADGDLRVDLSNNDISGLHGSTGNINAAADRAKSVTVRWGNVDEGNVQGDDLPSEKSGNFVQEHGHVVSLTGCNGLSAVTT